jgi:AcrR family transcriptional regulator
VVTRGSDATRVLLLRTAVRLFAEHGVEGVSLREIGDAAGQGNKAVVHYYFGSREGLLHALAEEYGSVDGGAPLGLPDDRRATAFELAGVLVDRLAAHLRVEPAWLVLTARIMGEGGTRRDNLASEPRTEWFVRFAARTLEDLGPDAAQRFRFAITLAVHALADMASRVMRGSTVELEELALPSLTRAIAAVLRSDGADETPHGPAAG